MVWEESACIYVDFFLIGFIAVKTVNRVSCINNVDYRVDSFAIQQSRRLSLAVRDEPEHNRQKQVRDSPEKVEGREQSVWLNRVLFNGSKAKPDLSSCESDRDANMAASHNFVNLIWGFNRVPSKRRRSSLFMQESHY